MTKRYVLDPIINKLRRDQVNEEWLENTMKMKREQMWDMQGPDISAFLK